MIRGKIGMSLELKIEIASPLKWLFGLDTFSARLLIQVEYLLDLYNQKNV
jgi:hypothetical protein